jgi:NAD(P)-dependent dehydrogenase (short-subunit alcohol dehydrogenase family)
MGITYDFKGQVALVTGAASGMGLATAWAFARAGAAVTLADISEEALQKAVDEIKSSGGNAIGVLCDVSDESQVTAMVEQTAINLRGVWACMKHELLQMRKQGSGVIVNCSSIGGLTGRALLAAYHGAKHGVIGLTRSAALEYAARGIRVNAVCPGDTLVDRWMEKGYFEGSDPVNVEKAMKESSAYIPMGRFGKPEEIAKAVLFLASDDSSFMTGHLLLVDGGNTAQ